MFLRFYLVEAGAAVVVDDVPNQKDRSEWPAKELADLMTNDAKLSEMKENCRTIAKRDAAEQIARTLLTFEVLIK